VRTPDKSAFVAKFLEALRSQGGGDGLVNAPELFSYLTTASPKPVISTFGDHEPGGEFLFIGKSIKLNASTQVSATTPVNTEADDRVFEKASSRNTVEAYQDYLDVFPEGRHVGECKAAITGLKPQPNTVQAETNTDPSKIPSDGFVLVTGGTFTMGSSETEPNRNSDEPQHKVTLSNFYISPYEVTQQQWKQVMGNNPSTGSKDCDQCPVESISWDDVQDFLRKLNIKSPGRNYRLPTEAEWEYAARGGKKIKNYLYAGSNDIGLVAWYTNNSGNKTQFVGKRKANELGLYDMSGNVWEWCSDWKDAYPFEDQTNPVGPPSGSNRVVRGGSWGSFPQYCQVKFRDGNPSGFRNYGVGFRLARTK
jgi:formylglycine-generating enzyme required for sulfatase activity